MVTVVQKRCDWFFFSFLLLLITVLNCLIWNICKLALLTLHFSRSYGLLFNLCAVFLGNTGRQASGDESI